MTSGRMKVNIGVNDKLIAPDGRPTTSPGDKGKGDYFYTWETSGYSNATSRPVYNLSNPYPSNAGFGIVRPSNGVSSTDTYRLITDGVSSKIYWERTDAYGQYNSITQYLDFNRSDIANFYSFSGLNIGMSSAGMFVYSYQTYIGTIADITNVSTYVCAATPASGQSIYKLFVATSSGVNCYSIDSSARTINLVTSTSLIGSDSILQMGYVSQSVVFISTAGIQQITFNNSTNTFGDSLVTVRSGTPNYSAIGGNGIAYVSGNTINFIRYQNGNWNTLITRTVPSTYDIRGIVWGTVPGNGINLLIIYHNTNEPAQQKRIETYMYTSTGTLTNTINNEFLLNSNVNWNLRIHINDAGSSTAYPLQIGQGDQFPSDGNFIYGVYLGQDVQYMTSATPPPLNHTYQNATLHIITSLQPLVTKQIRI